MSRYLLPALLLATGCAYFNTFYNARVYYRDALKLKEQNQATQAKAKFDKAIEKSAMVIKRWPKSRWVDDALFLVGLSYYQESYYSKAIRHFDQLSIAFPNSGYVPDAELYRGLSLLADKQYGTARTTLDGIKQKYPRLADAATFHLAKSFIDRDETERAIDSLGAFVERYPRSRFRRDALRYLAEGCFTLKRYADAERWYTGYVAMATDPKERARAKLKIAACRYAQGKHMDAIAQVQDVLGRYPELDDESNVLLGKALSDAGRTDDAVAAWSKVRGMTDYGAEAAFRIGKHHEEKTEFEKARAYYDTARSRRVDADYGVQAVKRLSLLDAFAQQKTGKREREEAMFLLAEVYNLNLGDYDKAIELYQQVYDSFPATDWAAKALFAKAWIIRNVERDTATAEPLLRQVIAEYPETDYADESRRWLGLPVPKREKKVVAKPETTAVAADTGKPAGVTPTPPPAEAGRVDTAAIVTPEPEMMPGRHVPGQERLQERIDETVGKTGVAPRPEHPPEPPKPPARVDTAALVRRDTGRTGVKPDTGQKRTEPAGRQVFAAVHFGTDSADIRPADAESLRRYAAVLKESADVRVEVVGYCDPRASEQYNLSLGFRRARAVKDALVAAGVAADRVEIRSEGKHGRLSKGPEEYWMDRRAEFRRL